MAVTGSSRTLGSSTLLVDMNLLSGRHRASAGGTTETSIRDGTAVLGRNEGLKAGFSRSPIWTSGFAILELPYLCNYGSSPRRGSQRDYSPVAKGRGSSSSTGEGSPPSHENTKNFLKHRIFRREPPPQDVTWCLTAMGGLADPPFLGMSPSEGWLASRSLPFGLLRSSWKWSFGGQPSLSLRFAQASEGWWTGPELNR